MTMKNGDKQQITKCKCENDYVCESCSENLKKKFKHQITLEQWNELSDEEVKHHLYVSLNGLGTMAFPPGTYGNEDMPTIGQLIEYLGDDLDYLLNNKDGSWTVKLIGGITFTGKEPIKPCWEATKHKLKQ